jgi:hypothetical protein
MVKYQQWLIPWTQGLLERQDKGMTHIGIKSANMFAVEMVREVLAHPLITPRHPNTVWRHMDMTSNDAPAATITIRRHGEVGDITAHCEMEFEGNTVVRGIIELIIGHRSWEFMGCLVDNRMDVWTTG